MNGDFKGRTVLIRSRFQPFTKFHAKMIQRLVEKAKGDPVGIIIIRDYETVSRWHKLSPRVESVDLRHLPIFNPYKSWEVLEHVNTCLREIDNCEKANIHVAVIPVKFQELHEIVRADTGERVPLPKDIEKFTKRIEICNIEFGKKCCVTQKCNVLNVLGKIISIVSYDAMPINFMFQWAFGIFDMEDKDDYNLAKKGTLETYEIPELNPPWYRSDLFQLELGLYGQFMYWIYLKFLYSFTSEYAKYWRERNKTWEITGPQEVKDAKTLLKYIERIEKIIKGYTFIDFNKYVSKVDETLGDFLKSFDRIPEEEQKVLLDCGEFIVLSQNSIKFCCQA